MIKARRGNLILLGLSNENMKRLANSEPIKFKLNSIIPELKEDMDVIIYNGKDEETMYLSLKQMGGEQN